MSGDFTSVQSQMVTNEFVNHLRILAVSQSADSYAQDIETLTNQYKQAIPDGLSANKPFAFSIVENFYKIIPLFDRILTDGNENDQDVIQTRQFLTVLNDSFKDVCLFDILIMLKNPNQYKHIFLNYVSLIKEIFFQQIDKYENLVNCLLPIVAYTSVFVTINENEIPSNLLSYFLTYVKTYGHNPSYENTVLYVLRLMKIFSKKPALVSMIIESQWPNACIQWLKNKTLPNNPRASYQIDYHICLVIQKLARHTAAVQILKDLQCLQILDESKYQMQKDHTELQMKCLNLLHCMIYALLMESNEIKEKSLLNDDRMCQALDQLVFYTIEASHTESLCYQCFHISEIIGVLSKLFVNDDILFKCLNGNDQLFQCFGQLTMHFAAIIFDINKTHLPVDDETLLILINLLWSISFHQTYHEKFRSNSLLMHSLSNLATSSSLYTSTSVKSVPRDVCSLKKAAEGILWNLKSSSGLLTKVANEKSTGQEKPLAMISYSHSDSTFCHQLVKTLSSYVPVWVDYIQANDSMAHSDDLWEEIARAMETATVIILVVSKEYYDSKSCRQELSYASDALKKRIVPIYPPNQQYRASGWLGIRIAGQKYVHFGRKLFTDAVKELAGMIVADQKPVIVSNPVQSLELISCPNVEYEKVPEDEEKQQQQQPEEKVKEFGINDWTGKEIRKWFEENHIHKNLIQLYLDQFRTGLALIIYARHLKLFYRFEYLRIYAKYYEVFQGKLLDTFDFITFVDALYRLRQEYDPNSADDDSFEKFHQQQLPRKQKALEGETTWL